MARKAQRRTGKAKKLAVKKESVRDRVVIADVPIRNAIVINSKAIRGMVIDRSVGSLFKRGT